MSSSCPEIEVRMRSQALSLLLGAGAPFLADPPSAALRLASDAEAHPNPTPHTH